MHTWDGTEATVRTSLRGAALLTIALAIAAAGAPGAAAKITRIEPGDACTILSVKQLGKTFGKPVVIDASASSVGNISCSAKIGADPTVTPGGTVVSFQDYPNLLAPQPGARAAVEDRRAIEVLSHNQVEDVNGVGLSAYLNRTTRAITVVATKKYAFSLTWNAAGATALTKADIKKLETAAKEVVTRAPK
jgi:hypothetical protein